MTGEEILFRKFDPISEEGRAKLQKRKIAPLWQQPGFRGSLVYDSLTEYLYVPAGSDFAYRMTDAPRNEILFRQFHIPDPNGWQHLPEETCICCGRAGRVFSTPHGWMGLNEEMKDITFTPFLLRFSISGTEMKIEATLLHCRWCGFVSIVAYDPKPERD